MQEENRLKPISKKLVNGTTVFIVTVLVISLTVISIWLLGLGKHRTMIENSLLSTSVLAAVFFLFLTIGLFKGIKLKNNISSLSENLQTLKKPDFADIPNDSAFFEGGEGILEAIINIILWVVVSVLIVVLLWVFGAILWTTILVFMAMLYWIFFRALRLVFKNSNKCKGDLTHSIIYGLGYTIVYTSWIYGIILATIYFDR